GVLIADFGGVTKSERLRAAARKLAGISDFVRSEAASRQRTCFLDVDFDRNRYRYREEPPRDAYGRYVNAEKPDEILSPSDVEEWKESFTWEALPAGVYFRKLWINHDHFYEKDTIEIAYKPTGMLNSYILWIQAAGDEDDHNGLWYSVSVNGLSG